RLPLAASARGLTGAAPTVFLRAKRHLQRSPLCMPLANREAVIAIQGGGVWALSLLGQARAVLSAGYTPLAIAGTSGGAILASLLWSGLTPREIEGAFIDMVQADRDALVDLLGDFDPPPPAGFTYAEFRRLGDEVTAALQGLNTWTEARPSAFAR